MPRTLEPSVDRFRIHYGRLRLRWWLTCAAMVVGVLLIVFSPHLFSEARAPSAGLAGLLMCAMAWMLHLLTFFLLMNMRCPRCGQRFALAGLNPCRMRTCKHCGLRVD